VAVGMRLPVHSGEHPKVDRWQRGLAGEAVSKPASARGAHFPCGLCKLGDNTVPDLASLSLWAAHLWDTSPIR
jgi:hypothetical protein